MTAEQRAAWSALIPARSTLPAPPKRIILHWTGGGPRANDVDKQHYHFIVDFDGRVTPGIHTVATNMRRVNASAEYALHTGGFNSFSIGVSMAGMLGWVPGGTTKYPLTEVQVRAAMEFVALLCKTYDLNPADPAQLFTHSEAWTLHKIKGTVNDQKTDVNFLPFRPDLGRAETGPFLRQLATAAFHAL